MLMLGDCIMEQLIVTVSFIQYMSCITRESFLFLHSGVAKVQIRFKVVSNFIVCCLDNVNYLSLVVRKLVFGDSDQV